MKKRSNLTIIIASLSTLVVLGSACSQEESAPQASNSAAPAVKKSLTLVLDNAGRKYPDGMNENTNPYLDYIRQKSNLNITVTTPPPDGYQDKINIMMTSGESYDLIRSTDSAWVSKLVKQKALTPLNKLIDQYGPNLKKAYPEEVWKQVTFEDGNIYALPGVTTKKADELMYVRKDWLAKLGLNPPKTLDEYTEVMRALATKDPDGNGKNDTIGLIIGEKLARTGPIFGAFGVPLGQNNWVERNGQLVHSYILPETKEALRYLAGLYKDKLIDSEWALNKPKNVDEKVAGGKVGLFSAQWHETRGSILTNKKNDPKADWVALDYPTGKDDKSGIAAINLVGSYAVIPATSKNAAEVIKMMDVINSTQGHETLKLGLPEHQIWVRKDSKLTMNFEEHNKHIYRNTLSEIANPWDDELERERLDALGLEFKMNDNINRINSHVIPNQYNGAPTEILGKYSSQLKKTMEESFTKIIMGTNPIDDFDAFVKQWKKEGGDEMMREVNEWYSKNRK